MKLKWTRKGKTEYECEKAEARGKAHGISLLTKVYSWLSKSNRTDDLNRSFEDEYFQNKLIDEYLRLHPTSPTSVQ